MPDPQETVALTADVFAAAVDGIGSISDTHLHVRIDVPGRLDAGRLLAALRSVSRAIPALGARYRRGWWRAHWIVESRPKWELDEQDEASPKEAEAIEAALFALPFEPCDDLPVRLRLLHLAENDRLLLRVSHIVADGGGTKNLCYLLAQAYREIDADPGWTPPPQRVPHPLVRILRSIRVSQLPGLVLGALHELAANRPMRPVLVPMGAHGPGTNRLAALHLPATRVSRLQARWRPSNVTLNDLALSAFCRAVESTFPAANASRSHAALVVTGDLRQYLPPTLDVSNFSSLRPLPLGRLPLPGPRDQLERVVRETRIWKAGQTGLLQGGAAIAFVSTLPHAWVRRFISLALRLLLGRQGGCIALTNIGPIRADMLDFGHGPCVAARVAAPVAHAPMLITALTGCAGALDFTVAYREPQLEPAAAERLVQAFDHELSALEDGVILPRSG